MDGPGSRHNDRCIRETLRKTMELKLQEMENAIKQDQHPDAVHHSEPIFLFAPICSETTGPLAEGAEVNHLARRSARIHETDKGSETWIWLLCPNKGRR